MESDNSDCENVVMRVYDSFRAAEDKWATKFKSGCVTMDKQECDAFVNYDEISQNFPMCMNMKKKEFCKWAGYNAKECEVRGNQKGTTNCELVTRFENKTSFHI